jgi:hypothetical protein
MSRKVAEETSPRLRQGYLGRGRLIAICGYRPTDSH